MGIETTSETWDKSQNRMLREFGDSRFVEPFQPELQPEVRPACAYLQVLGSPWRPCKL